MKDKNQLNKIVILVGNIGSGKTTLCKKLVKEEYLIISRDAFRYMIGNGEYIFDLKTEKSIKQLAVAATEIFMKNHLNIVIDETNMSKESREEYIKLANKYNYYKIAYIMPTYSMTKSVNRRLKNPHGNFGRKVWQEVWKRFHNNYCRPELAEGFNLIWS